MGNKRKWPFRKKDTSRALAALPLPAAGLRQIREELPCKYLHFRVEPFKRHPAVQQVFAGHKAPLFDDEAPVEKRRGLRGVGFSPPPPLGIPWGKVCVKRGRERHAARIPWELLVATQERGLLKQKRWRGLTLREASPPFFNAQLSVLPQSPWPSPGRDVKGLAFLETQCLARSPVLRAACASSGPAGLPSHKRRHSELTPFPSVPASPGTSAPC